MLFNSFNFFLTLSGIFATYWLLPCKAKNLRKWFLTAVSYLFYMNWNAAHTLILLGVTVITYLAALCFERTWPKRRRRLLGTAFALLTLLPLLTFKYYRFITESVQYSLECLGLSFTLPGVNWAVPVGISFFTFQAYGYMMDVYYRHRRAERSFSDYLLFISFFPQLASGPISKADELLPQIKQMPSFSYAGAVKGLRLLLWGLFLKVAVADRAGYLADTVFGTQDFYSGLDNIYAALCYSLQIYADFAGYSFMAIGTGRLLGFTMINNFRRPYLSASVTEFWHRWHISLSRWLKDYVYIPLGGSRCSRTRNYLNILVTFLISGLWHGANWTFIVWGLLHGCLQVVEKMLKLQKNTARGFVRLVRMTVTFMLITFTWIFFRAETLGKAVDFIINTGNWKGNLFPPAFMGLLAGLAICLIPIIFAEIMQEFFPSALRRLTGKKVVRWTGYAAIAVLGILFGSIGGGSFIYVCF